MRKNRIHIKFPFFVNIQTAEVEYSANLSAMPSGDNLVVKVSVPYGNSLAIDKISTIWR